MSFFVLVLLWSADPLDTLFCLLYSVDEQSLPCDILHPYSLAAGLQMLDIPIKDSMSLSLLE